jgi:hypothetical protein
VGSPLAKPVPVVLTALLVHPVVRIPQLLVLLEPMPVVQQRVMHAVLGNTTLNPVKRLNQLLVKIATWENTKTKRGKHPAKHVQLVLTVALLAQQVVLVCTRNGRVASVATVVVVGVKLPR